MLIVPVEINYRGRAERHVYLSFLAELSYAAGYIRTNMVRCKQEQKISSACIVCGDNSPAENKLEVSAKLSVRTITSNSLTVLEIKVNIFNKLNIYY